jgi:drug/metabolite transporter (DMT)-like permease
MKHYLYALGAILCWASLPAATGSGLSELSTEELMFYNFSTAAIFLYIQDVILTKKLSVAFPDIKASLFGFSGLFLYHYIYYLALERAPLAEGAILATTWSLWIVVFSSIIQLRRLAPSILGTALLGFAGAALVIAGHRCRQRAFFCFNTFARLCVRTHLRCYLVQFLRWSASIQTQN